MDCHPRYYNKRLSIFCRNVKPNALYGYPPPMELGDLSALKPVLRGVLPYWCKSQVLPARGLARCALASFANASLLRKGCFWQSLRKVSETRCDPFLF